MEPLSAIGLAASIIQFIEVGVKIVERISSFSSDASQIPAAFRQVKIELPLVIDGLRRIHTQAVSGSLEPSTEKSLIPVIQECQQAAKKLDELLDKTIPSAGASSWERKKLALVSLGRDKDVEHLANSIAGFVRVLTFHQVIGSSAQLHVLEREKKAGSGGKSWVLLPFDRNSMFVGRRPIFYLIDEIFQVKPGTQPKAALYGLGGIGKSQIALEYCYLKLETNNELSVFWINAATATAFEESFNRIASQCELTKRDDSSTDRVLLVQDWLQTRHAGPWLMVVDNVDDEGSFFRDKIRNGKTPSQCIPHRSHGSLLFTTRSSDMAVDLATPAEPIPVSRLSEEEGIQLVKERLPRKLIQNDQVLELLEELEYIPIAITQAVAFISKRRVKSVAQYLEQYRKNDSSRTRMLTYEFTEHGRHHGSLESVAKTWSLSFEGIRSNNTRAADLLCLVSFFQHQGIPRLLLQSALSGDQDQDTDPVDELEEAIAVLRAYSFIDASEDETTFNTHHLIQLATRWWLRTQQSPQELANWAYTALQSVARVFPKPITTPPSGYFSLCESLFPHAETLLTLDFKPLLSSPSPNSTPPATSTSQRDIDLERATLLGSTGRYLYWPGSYTEEVSRLEESFALRTAHLGESHPLTLKSMGVLLWALVCQPLAPSPSSIADKIVPLGRRLLALRTQVLGPDHPDTIDGLSDLAWALQLAKEYAESESLQREAVDRSTRVLGATHDDTLNCISHLADVLEDLDRLEEALTLKKQVYNLKLKNLGPEHPDVLVHGHNLAMALVELASSPDSSEDEADDVHSSAERKSLRKDGIELMSRIYEMKRRVRGVDHRETLVSADLLVYYYTQERKTGEKALELAEKVLADVDTGLRQSRSRPETSRVVGRIEEYRDAMLEALYGTEEEDEDDESEGFEHEKDEYEDRVNTEDKL